MCMLYILSTSLALVYIMHQRPRITRVLAEYAGGGRVLVLIAKSLWNLPCMRQLSELAHEYTAMGASAQSNRSGDDVVSTP